MFTRLIFPSQWLPDSFMGHMCSNTQSCCWISTNKMLIRSQNPICGWTIQIKLIVVYWDTHGAEILSWSRLASCFKAFRRALHRVHIYIYIFPRLNTAVGIRDTHPLQSDFLKLVFNFCAVDLRRQRTDWAQTLAPFFSQTSLQNENPRERCSIMRLSYIHRGWRMLSSTQTVHT